FDWRRRTRQTRHRRARHAYRGRHPAIELRRQQRLQPILPPRTNALWLVVWHIPFDSGGRRGRGAGLPAYSPFRFQRSLTGDDKSLPDELRGVYDRRRRRRQSAVEQSGNGKNGPGARIRRSPAIGGRSNANTRLDRADLPDHRLRRYDFTAVPRDAGLDGRAWADDRLARRQQPRRGSDAQRPDLPGERLFGRELDDGRLSRSEEQRRVGLPARGHIWQFHRDSEGDEHRG